MDLYELMQSLLYEKFGKTSFIADTSDKLPHKIPVQCDVEHEKEINEWESVCLFPMNHILLRLLPIKLE